MTLIISKKMTEKFRVEIQLASFLPAAILNLMSKIEDVTIRILNVLPFGYTLDDLEVHQSSKKIIVHLTKFNSPTIIATVAALSTALLPLLIVFGIIIIGVKIFNVTQSKIEQTTTKTKAELVTDLAAAGMSSSQINDILDKVNTQGGLSTETMIILGVAAVVVLIILVKK